MAITIGAHKYQLTDETSAATMNVRLNFLDKMRRQMAELVAPKLAEEELLRMTADVVSAYVLFEAYDPLWGA